MQECDTLGIKKFVNTKCHKVQLTLYMYVDNKGVKDLINLWCVRALRLCIVRTMMKIGETFEPRIPLAQHF